MSKKPPPPTVRPPPDADRFVSGGATPAHPPAPASSTQEFETYVVTTFRITQAQANALRIAAVNLQASRSGRGKADASEVLRGILDRWMAEGGGR